MMQFGDIQSEPGTARGNDDAFTGPPTSRVIRGPPTLRRGGSFTTNNNNNQHLTSGGTAEDAAASNVFPSPSFFSSAASSSAFSSSAAGGGGPSSSAFSGRTALPRNLKARDPASQQHHHHFSPTHSPHLQHQHNNQHSSSAAAGANPQQSLLDASIFAWIVRCSLITSMPLKDLNKFLTDSLRFVDRLIARAAEAALAAEAHAELQELENNMMSHNRQQQQQQQQQQHNNANNSAKGSSPSSAQRRATASSSATATPTNSDGNSKQLQASATATPNNDLEMQQQQRNSSSKNTTPQKQKQQQQSASDSEQEHHHHHHHQQQQQNAVSIAVPTGISALVTSSMTGLPHSNSGDTAANFTGRAAGPEQQQPSSQKKAENSNNNKSEEEQEQQEQLDDPMSQVLFQQLSVFFEAVRKLPPSCFRNLLNNGEDATFAGSVCALAQLWTDSLEHMAELQQLLSTQHQWGLLTRSASNLAAQAASRFVLIPDSFFGNPVSESENVPQLITGALGISYILMILCFFIRVYVVTSGSNGDTAMLVLFIIGAVVCGVCSVLLRRRFGSLRTRLRSILSVVMHHLQASSSSSSAFTGTGTAATTGGLAAVFSGSNNSSTGTFIGDSVSQQGSADFKQQQQRSPPFGRSPNRSAQNNNNNNNLLQRSQSVTFNEEANTTTQQYYSNNSNYNAKPSADLFNSSASAEWWLKAMPGGAMILPSKPNMLTSIAPGTPMDHAANKTGHYYNSMTGGGNQQHHQSSSASALHVFRSSAQPVATQARSAAAQARRTAARVAGGSGGGAGLRSSNDPNENSGSGSGFFTNNNNNSGFGAAGGFTNNNSSNTSICLDMHDVHKLLFVVCFDFNLVVTQWNATAEEVTGFLARECVGKKLQELMQVPEDVLVSLVNRISSKREHVTVQVQSLNTGVSVLKGSMVPTFDAEYLYVNNGPYYNAAAQSRMRMFRSSSLPDASVPSAAAAAATSSGSGGLATLGGPQQQQQRSEAIGFAFVSALQADDTSRASSLVLNFKASMMRQTVEALSIECRSALRGINLPATKTLMAENMAVRVYRSENDEGKETSEHALSPIAMANQIRYVQSLRVLVRGTTWEHISHTAQYLQDDWEILSPEQLLSSAVRYHLSKVVETKCGGGNADLPKDLRVSPDTSKITKAMVAACPGKARVLIYGQETARGNRRLIFSVECVAAPAVLHTTATSKDGQQPKLPPPHDTALSREMSVSNSNSGGLAGQQQQTSNTAGAAEEEDAVNAGSVRSLSGHSDSAHQHHTPPPALNNNRNQQQQQQQQQNESTPPRPFEFDELFHEVAGMLQTACGVLFPSADARCVMLFLPCISSKHFVESAANSNIAGKNGVSNNNSGMEATLGHNRTGSASSPSFQPDFSGQWGSVSLHRANLSFSATGGEFWNPNGRNLNSASGSRTDATTNGGSGGGQQQQQPQGPVALTPLSVALLFDNQVDVHNITNILFAIRNVSVSVCQTEADLVARLPFVDLILIDWDLLPEIEAKKPVLKKQLFVLPCVPADWAPAEGEEGIESQVVYRPFDPNVVVSKVVEASQLVLDIREKEKQELEHMRILQARNDGPWQRGRQLGKGSFGTVYEAVFELTGAVMAVKCFNLTMLRERAAVDADPDAYSKVLRSLTNEIQVMCKLSHSNIVYYSHCEQTEASLNLFMELCDRSLQDLIVARRLNRGKLEAAAPTIARQTLQAVAYLHERGVIHRDLKPMNILLRGDKLKLTDFGTAAQLTAPGEQLTETQGTFRFMAPEVFRGESYNEKCDIWSLGCVMAEILNLELSFMDPLNSAMGPAGLETVELPPVSASFSETARDFVSLCLQVRQEDRPLASALLLHPYVDLGQDGEDGVMLSQLKGGERKGTGAVAAAAAASASKPHRSGGHRDVSGGGQQQNQPQQQSNNNIPNPLTPSAMASDGRRQSTSSDLSPMVSSDSPMISAGPTSSGGGLLGHAGRGSSFHGHLHHRPVGASLATTSTASGLGGVGSSGGLNPLGGGAASTAAPTVSRSGSWRSNLSVDSNVFASQERNTTSATGAHQQQPLATTTIVVQPASPQQHQQQYSSHNSHRRLSQPNERSVNLAGELGALAESDQD